MNRTGSIGFPGAAGGDQDPPPGEVAGAGAEDVGGRGHDAGGVGEAPGADVAAGQPARLGIDDVYAAAAQQRQVVLHRGVFHISVCMAGARRTGARVASSVAVSRSLEMPAA